MKYREPALETYDFGGKKELGARMKRAGFYTAVCPLADRQSETTNKSSVSK